MIKFWDHTLRDGVLLIGMGAGLQVIGVSRDSALLAAILLLIFFRMPKVYD